MAREVSLPAVLRRAGLTVHEVAGWRTRGGATFGPVAGIVCHATAGSPNASDADEIRVLLEGSATAPAPIAQLYLGRQGHWWVVASGRCNHIGNAPLHGTGRSGNRYAIGIEAANDNRRERWPEVQYESYVTGVAALCRHFDLGTRNVYGHKEISESGKSDPTFAMNVFRNRVGMRMSEGFGQGGDDMTPAQENALRNTENLLDALVRGTLHLPPRRIGTYDAPAIDIVPNQRLAELSERVAELETGGLDPATLAAHLVADDRFMSALAGALAPAIAEHIRQYVANG